MHAFTAFRRRSHWPAEYQALHHTGLADLVGRFNDTAILAPIDSLTSILSDISTRISQSSYLGWITILWMEIYSISLLPPSPSHPWWIIVDSHGIPGSKEGDDPSVVIWFGRSLDAATEAIKLYTLVHSGDPDKIAKDPSLLCFRIWAYRVVSTIDQAGFTLEGLADATQWVQLRSGQSTSISISDVEELYKSSPPFTHPIDDKINIIPDPPSRDWIVHTIASIFQECHLAEKHFKQFIEDYPVPVFLATTIKDIQTEFSHESFVLFILIQISRRFCLYWQARQSRYWSIFPYQSPHTPRPMPVLDCLSSSACDHVLSHAVPQTEHIYCSWFTHDNLFNVMQRGSLVSVPFCLGPGVVGEGDSQSPPRDFIAEQIRLRLHYITQTHHAHPPHMKPEFIRLVMPRAIQMPAVSSDSPINFIISPSIFTWRWGAPCR